MELIHKKGIKNGYLFYQSWLQGGTHLLKALAEGFFEWVFIQGDPEIRLAEIKKSVRCIKAGGGLVINEVGELLLIYRNGKWDLPKGKWETNETMAECALREVKEETGLHHIQLGNFIETTRHFYCDEHGWVLKETDWYFMKAPMQALVPQTEEGITVASWVSTNKLNKHLINTYFSIKHIIEVAGYC